MRRPLKRLVAALALGSLAVPLTASATNGYFLIGYGSKSRGMGGVGTAYGQDGLAAAYNPAAMAEAIGRKTMRVDVGADLFLPRRAAYHNSSFIPADEVSGSNLFLIPNMGGIYRFNRKMVMGMAAIGAGLGTRYNQTVPGNPDCIDQNDGPLGDNSKTSYFFNASCNADSPTVGVMLIQMQMLPSLAYQIDRDHTVGASIALAGQMFRAYGLGAFQNLGFATTTEHVSGQGNDWSYGAGFRVGYEGKFFDDKVVLGLNYASRVYMSKFDKYRNLFAEQGDFDIPEHWSVGLAFHPNKKWTVAFDWQRINFGDIKSVGNPGPSAYDQTIFNPLPGCQPPGGGADLPECKLGGDKGLGFGWDDINVYKLGVDWDYNDHWTFRAGLNYGDNPVPKDQILFNLLAPGIMQEHVTMGFTYSPSEMHHFSVNLVHALKKTLTGPTRFPPADPANPGQNLPAGTENAAASMYQYTLGASYGFSF